MKDSALAAAFKPLMLMRMLLQSSLVLLLISQQTVLGVQTRVGLRPTSYKAGLVPTKPVGPEDIVSTQATEVVFCKLKNVNRRRMDVYAEEMDDFKGQLGEMRLIGSLASGTSTSMALHDKQRVHFTLPGSPDEIEGSFVLSSEQGLYPVGQGMESSCPELLQELIEEQEFSRVYESQRGMPWRHFYGFSAPHFGPREPPKIASKMWPADFEGQTHLLPELSLTLQVVSTSPKVFAIKDFLTVEEADALIELGRGHMQQSVVGSSTMGVTQSDTKQRSSSTAWASPEDSPVLKEVYLRAADLLGVDREDMFKWSESLQLVHYDKEQHYSAHYDFEVTSTAPQSRFATLLLYLNDQASDDAGGETAFPVATRADGTRGFKIHPGKCGAVLFYNLHADGNCDIQSLHAALPVKKGEKWAANIWLWG